MSSIVVIESDKLMRDLLVEWLSAAGYSVRTPAPADVEASADPDLVIVDVYMPRHEGLQRLRAVKAANPETPMIAVSGQFRPGLGGSPTIAEARGVEHVIAQTLSRRDVLAAVHGALR